MDKFFLKYEDFLCEHMRLVILTPPVLAIFSVVTGWKWVYITFTIVFCLSYWAFKLWKRGYERKHAPKYKIAFCDKPDLSTKFGEENKVFDSYLEADAYRRYNWYSQTHNAEQVNGGFKIDSAWLMIEEVKND